MEEKGMFSYWEETMADYEVERETKRKGRWLCPSVFVCGRDEKRELSDFHTHDFATHIFEKLLIWHLILMMKTKCDICNAITSVLCLIVNGG